MNACKSPPWGDFSMLSSAPRKNSKIVGLGYVRAMPKIEGFGVQEFVPLHFETEDAKKLMIFSMNGKNVCESKLLQMDPIAASSTNFMPKKI